MVTEADRQLLDVASTCRYYVDALSEALTRTRRGSRSDLDRLAAVAGLCDRLAAEHAEGVTS